VNDKAKGKSEKEPNKGKKKKEEPKAEVAQAEVQKPLPVQIQFPNIFDLKQAIAFDSNSNLVMAIQFKVRVDQFELFRLVNLLKQPHGGLSATIQSPQSAMDFRFHKEGRVEIVKAQIAADVEIVKAQIAADNKKKLPEAKPKEKPAEPAEIEATVHGVTFNHNPEDERPFGVFIEYVLNGSGEIKSAAGRGTNPTEAVIEGVHNCGIVAADMTEPFEVRSALELLQPNSENYKLILALDVGAFDDNLGGNSDIKEGG
jgi:hypothetical protein